MEINHSSNTQPDNEERSCSAALRSWFKSKREKIETDVGHIGRITKQVAKDDPRRILHSIKVGLAITLVSLFYYFDPLYEGFGVNAMWAVLTVVVVFEFSVGATLGKGVNRVVATITGGLFGVGAHRLSSLPGDDFEPAFLGLAVFLVAAIVTFMRFFPKLKARFDYLLVIFILTFSLICVSGYRDDEVIDMACRRITTILIGCSAAVVICVLISPVWASSDLHQLVASHIDQLGDFFLEYGGEYFKNEADETSKDQQNASLDGVKSVLNSKSTLDSLVNIARWEPGHGRFKHRHPWEQYLKVGDLIRHCACLAEALHGYLTSQNQAPRLVKDKLREPCTNMSIESGKALKDLSEAMTKMTHPSNVKYHIQNAKRAAEDLNHLLRSSTTALWSDPNSVNLSLSDLAPAATVASLLADVVTCTESIAEAVEELALLAGFRNADYKVSPQLEREKSRRSMKQQRSLSDHIIMINGRSTPSPSRVPICEDPTVSQQVAE